MTEEEAAKRFEELWLYRVRGAREMEEHARPVATEPASWPHRKAPGIGKRIVDALLPPRPKKQAQKKRA